MRRVRRRETRGAEPHEPQLAFACPRTPRSLGPSRMVRFSPPATNLAQPTRGLADSQATYISSNRSKYIQTLKRKTLSTSAYHSQTNPRQTSDCSCNQKKRMKSNTTTDERTARRYSSSAGRENPVGSCMGQWIGIEKGLGGIGVVCIYRSSSLSDE